MAKVLPFRGYRYNTERFSDLDEVTAPPYDIISPERQDALYRKNPYNIVKIDYGKEYENDTSLDNRYTRAASDLKDWIDRQVLVQEDTSAFYIYEEVFALKGETQKSFKGIFSLVQLEEFSKKIILPHEETLPKAKADRYELMCATKGNLSPIFSLYTDPDSVLTSILYEITQANPDISFTTAEQVKQNIWVVKDAGLLDKISKAFEGKQLFIADGHHRYETALAYRDEQRAKNPDAQDAPYDYVMMMLVAMEDSGLTVFPTHRMIHGVNNFDEMQLIGMLMTDFHISKIFFTDDNYAEVITARLVNTLTDKLFAFYTGEDYYYLLKLKDFRTIDRLLADKSEAYRHLDVSILHSLILERCLGIDKESLEHQKNLTYTRRAREAIEGVRAKQYQCSFLINPTKIEEIKKVSLANEKMPQKSTYFWPKPVTGIVLYLF